MAFSTCRKVADTPTISLPLVYNSLKNSRKCFMGTGRYIRKTNNIFLFFFLSFLFFFFFFFFFFLFFCMPGFFFLYIYKNFVIARILSSICNNRYEYLIISRRYSKAPLFLYSS